jgi:hypothetical protein
LSAATHLTVFASLIVFKLGKITMEPQEIIDTFLRWLNQEPSIFKSAWPDLPELETQIAESADDELFPIAMTISKWCAKHQLGQTLRDAIDAQKIVENLPAGARGDIHPRKLKTSTKPPLDNITQILRDSIQTVHNQQQNASLTNIADTNNEPN